MFRPSVNLVGAAYIDLALAGYRAQSSGDLVGAEQNYLASIKINDKSAEAWFNLGIIYVTQNREKDAADAYARASELKPSDGKYRDAAFKMNYRVGAKAVAEGDHAQAAVYLQRAVRIDSNHKMAWKLYADVLHTLGRTEDEKQALERFAKTEAR